MTLRLVMMGTGSFALPTFRALYETSHQVVGLFTQPDRSGIGHHQHAHPMKQESLERGTPVYQPRDVNEPESIDDFRSLNADLCVVAAYGQILAPTLLRIPRLGAINVHASLLPKFRGASPIHYAILNGETETGITIFQVEPELDAGPILGNAKTRIGPKETSGELEQRLAELAVAPTVRVIDQIECGKVERLFQNVQQVTKAPRLTKGAGQIDWTQSAEQIGRHVRAMQPWPSPFTFLRHGDCNPLRLIVLEADPRDVTTDANADPGSVIRADSRQLFIQTGHGALEIIRLQPEGKRAMSTAEFLHGHPVQVGDRLETSPATR